MNKMKRYWLALSLMTAFSTINLAGPKADKTEFVERGATQLRSGTLVVREQRGGKDDGNTDLALKINGKVKKIMELEPSICGGIMGQYQIGDIDVVAVDQPSCGCGNGCGDSTTIILLSFDKSGNVSPPESQ